MLRKIIVVLLPDGGGLVIFLRLFFAKKAPRGVCWVVIGGQVPYINAEFVVQIAADRLLLRTSAFTVGFDTYI